MKPKVLPWFKTYCAVLTAMYVVLLPVGFMYLLVDPESLQMQATEAKIMGTIFIAMSAPLAIATALPFFVKPVPWLWVYDLVIICLGMTSCCFMPACIPLLIFWIKPETKQYFGK